MAAFGSFRRRASRPPGHAKLDDDASEAISSRFNEGHSQLGRYASPSRSSVEGAPSHASRAASTDGLVAADWRVATYMSEQQSIISELRQHGASGMRPEELMESGHFQALVARLGAAQTELRDLIGAGGGAGRVGAAEQRLLVRQSATMLELLDKLTATAASAETAGGAAAPSRTDGSERDPPRNPAAALGSGAPVFLPANSSPAATGRQQASGAPPSPPMLIDFS